MDLYLQFGWGMKSCTIDLAKKWGEATVILSPRDIEPESLERWSKDFAKNDVKTLFDPQCYFPHDKHERLSRYGYHNLVSYTELGDDSQKEELLLKRIKYYNNIANTTEYILPGIMCKKIDNEWFEKNRSLIENSVSIMNDKKRLMTITIPQSALMFNNDAVEMIIQETENWNVDGYYIIAEHPENKYLVEDTIWMSNLLELCSGLKLQNKKVILGYANHQFLCCSIAKIDAIATGTFLNVRTFRNKFTDEDGEPKKRNTWYYYAQSLSEYKLTFLDLAQARGILDRFKPDENYKDEYVKLLFNGAQPTTTSFNETSAFKHYLHSLKMQIKYLERNTYKETVAAQEMLLETAERNLEFNKSNGIYAQDRGFEDCIDINRAAINSLDKNRGFILDKMWNEI